MEETTIVADNTEVVATPQDTTTTTDTTVDTTTTEVQGSEVVDTTDSTTQVNETKAYSERLNAYAQKQIDAEYDRLYGAEYGIHSKAEYDKAIAEQEQAKQNEEFEQQYGIDPKVIDDRVKALLEEHPTVKAAREQENTMVKNNAAMELSKVAKSLGINEEIKTWEDVEKLPKWDSIKQGVVNNNLDIVTAAKLAYFDEVVNSTSTKVQQETINKITANGASSPGSLVNHGTEETFFTKEQVDKMPKEEVLKNYDQIIKSTPKW